MWYIITFAVGCVVGHYWNGDMVRGWRRQLWAKVQKALSKDAPLK